MVKIAGDGNSFYRCASYFLGEEINFKDIKNLINDWIDINYNQFKSFFTGN